MSHVARKRFGQHFLVDEHIITTIIKAISFKKGDNGVEIGPGLGALTFPLLSQLEQLKVIEIDRNLALKLRENASKFGEIDVILQDVLTVDFTKLGDNLKVFGNLPYNISTPLLLHLNQFFNCINEMTFMLQNEVVDRLVAAPGNKAYGRLSVMMQYSCQVEKLFIVPPTAFKPKPKVDSAVVQLIPHMDFPHGKTDRKVLEKVVKAAFHMRRKTLKNNLKSEFDISLLEKKGINLSRRAEQLSVGEYVVICEHLLKENKA